jgi:RNA polymerase sigma-70 factor (ECF subfamily)
LSHSGPTAIDENASFVERAEPWPLMAKTHGLLRHARAEPVQLEPAAPISVVELVERIGRGDRWAEEAFYRRHVGLVQATVRRLLGRSSEAEDVVQDAFVTAFEIWDQLREPERAKDWLLTIAIRKVHRRFRRRRLSRLLGLDQSTDDATLEALARPDLGGEARAELSLLDRVLRKVPAEARIAWMLRHVEGASLEEVASLCECSLATAKRRIAVAQVKVSEHVLVSERAHE